MWISMVFFMFYVLADPDGYDSCAPRLRLLRTSRDLRSANLANPESVSFRLAGRPEAAAGLHSIS